MTALAELSAPRGAEDFLGATWGREMEVFRGTRGRFSYASFGPQHAFGTHWDDHEVLVFQVHGRKRWRVFGLTRIHPARRDVEQPRPPAGEPLADFILDEGDLLHIPRGWWHDVTVADAASLHHTAGVTPATGADLIAWATDQLLRCELIRQDVPVHASADVQQRYTGRLTEALARELSAAQAINRFRASRDALAPARSHVCLPWSATDDGLPPETDPCLRLTARVPSWKTGTGRPSSPRTDTSTASPPKRGPSCARCSTARPTP